LLKGYLEPESSHSRAGITENPVQERLKAQRSLFQPLTPITTAPRADSGSVLVVQPDSEPAGAETPVSSVASSTVFSSKKLLQGNQHKQRATRFDKIGFDGQVLADTALRWSCARDTRTGLLWETKLFDAGISDVEHRYSWYDPTRATRGYKNRGSCYGMQCDTYAYTQEMNRLGLCGSRQWRLPMFAELETLLDRDYFNPVINQEIFFNTRSASYWTQSQLENNPEMIMQIDFFNGTSSPAPIHFKLAVRLVSE